MLRKLVSQAGSVAAMRIVGTGLSVAVSIVIARLFGAEALGAYAYCVALLALAAVPISYGWSSMMLRTVARKNSYTEEARTMAHYGAFGALMVAMTAGLIGFAAVKLATSSIAALIQPIALLALGMLALTLLCDQISAMRMATIRGVNRPAIAQLPESFVRPSILLAGLVLAWSTFGIRDTGSNLAVIFGALAVAALTSAAIGQLVLKSITIRRPRAKVEPAQRKQWIISALTLAGSAGLVQLNGYVDMLLLGVFEDAATVGLYRAALQIAMLASFGYIALNMIAAQRFSRYLGSDNNAGLASIAKMLSRIALLTAIPLPVAIWLFGEPILAFAFGPEFSASARPALIISSALCFSASVGMAHSLLTMSHREALALRLTAVALAVNIALCLALIPKLGLIGAAISNASSSVIWNALLWYFARSRTGIDTSIFGLQPIVIK